MVKVAQLPSLPGWVHDWPKSVYLFALLLPIDIGPKAGANGWFPTVIGFFLSPPTFGSRIDSSTPGILTSRFFVSNSIRAYFVPQLLEIIPAITAVTPPALPLMIISRASRCFAVAWCTGCHDHVETVETCFSVVSCPEVE